MDCKLLQQCITDSQWYVCVYVIGQKAHGQEFIFQFFLSNDINIKWIKEHH